MLMNKKEKITFSEMIHESFITAKIFQCVNLHIFLQESDGMKAYGSKYFLPSVIHAYSFILCKAD